MKHPWLGERSYRKHYDAEEAAEYVRGKEGDARRHRQECDLVRKAMASIPAGESVLDIPCGGGRMSLLLWRAGYPVTAADVSPAMVELARQAFADAEAPIEVRCEDLESTLYGADAFDNVFCFRLFHHFPSEELRHQAAAELCRIARQRIVISYQDSRSLTSWRRRWFRRRDRPERRWPLSPDEMAGYFAPHGFRPISDHAQTPWIRSLRVMVLEK